MEKADSNGVQERTKKYSDNTNLKSAKFWVLNRFINCVRLWTWVIRIGGLTVVERDINDAVRRRSTRREILTSSSKTNQQVKAVSTTQRASCHTTQENEKDVSNHTLRHVSCNTRFLPAPQTTERVGKPGTCTSSSRYIYRDFVKSK